MEVVEERRKVGTKKSKTQIRELFEVTISKIKLGDDGYDRTKTHWEGLWSYWHSSRKCWVKGDKKKFNDEFDAKFWLKTGD